MKSLELQIIIQQSDLPVQPKVWIGNGTSMKSNTALSCVVCHPLLWSVAFLVPSLKQP